MPAPPRPELLRQVRARLGDIDSGLRFVAERLLGADSPIDLLAVDRDGRAVLLLVGDVDDDLALLARALAQKAWAVARLRDWAQLGPQLGLRPEGGARVILVCPRFRPETRLAAEALGPETPWLVRAHWLRGGEAAELLLETELAPAGARPVAPGPAQPAHFRSGLSEEDLALSPEEREAFQDPPPGETNFGTGDNS